MTPMADPETENEIVVSENQQHEEQQEEEQHEEQQEQGEGSVSSTLHDVAEPEAVDQS